MQVSQLIAIHMVFCLAISLGSVTPMCSHILQRCLIICVVRIVPCYVKIDLLLSAMMTCLFSKCCINIRCFLWQDLVVLTITQHGYLNQILQKINKRTKINILIIQSNVIFSIVLKLIYVILTIDIVQIKLCINICAHCCTLTPQSKSIVYKCAYSIFAVKNIFKS